MIEVLFPGGFASSFWGWEVRRVQFDAIPMLPHWYRWYHVCSCSCCCCCCSCCCSCSCSCCCCCYLHEMIICGICSDWTICSSSTATLHIYMYPFIHIVFPLSISIVNCIQVLMYMQGYRFLQVSNSDGYPPTLGRPKRFGRWSNNGPARVERQWQSC